MLDLATFRRAELAVRAAGYTSDISWSEEIRPPHSAEFFALEAAFVICNSGMRFTVASKIYHKVKVALEAGGSAHDVFGHKGKAIAIDTIWRERERLFSEYLAAPDKLAFCESLPWIGGITKYHLAKNFGADVAKPDVHLQRLADAEGCTPQELCERLSAESYYRVATVDLILWRACAIGALNSRDWLRDSGRQPKAEDPLAGLSGEAMPERRPEEAASPNLGAR